MKNLYIKLFIILFIATGFYDTILAQAPEGVVYQAEARDDKGKVLLRANLEVKIAIHQDNLTGTIVWEGLHQVTTNDYGMFVLVIGEGTSTYIFEDIEWATHLHFLNVQVKDPKTSVWVDMGTTQLLSVPYALHAKTASAVLTEETDPVFIAWDKSSDISITESQISDLQHFTASDETDPEFNAWDKSSGISITESQIMDLQHFTTADETDPEFNTWDKSSGISITESQVSDLQHFTASDETDPEFNAWDKSTGISIMESQISDFGSYLTSETQNLSDVISINNSANAQIKNVTNPTDAQDAATKAYVDALEARISQLETILNQEENGTFTDIRDDTEYNWIKIGDQIWMAENLKYLPSVVGPGTESYTDPYYYIFDYDGTDVAAAMATANYNTYGVLYNWPAAMNSSASSATNPSGVQGVCPAGWHLPSDAEWTEMTDYLIDNGYGFEGSGDDIAKSLAATTNWVASTTSGAPGNDPASNNSSGFTALPGNWRNLDGSFIHSTNSGLWWSSTETGTYDAWYRTLNYFYIGVRRLDSYKVYGNSVRCVRD